MKKREFGPDLVRAAAVSFVLAVHFFLYTGFYDTPLAGAGMAAATTVRMALMTCVPLFLMLTGYLCSGKTWSRDYYRGLVHTLVIYLLACAACLLFRRFYLGEEMVLLGAFRRILEFSAAPYSWYIEMYIGLFLLIPFFNAGWHVLSDKAKKALILTLAALASLPTVANLKYQLVPEWWTDLYPLMYYAIGAWLREHPVAFKRRWLLLGWLGFSALTAALQFFLFRGGVFSWSPSNNRGSLLVLGETFCVFCLLISCGGEKAPRAVKWCVRRLARLSLPIYLLSYITDQLIYGPLNGAFDLFLKKLPFLPLMALIDLALTGLMAQLADWAAGALMRMIPKKKANEGENKA